MSKNEIGIYISAKDNYSQAILTMQNANRAFNKDLDGLSSKLDELNKSKTTLKLDTDKAKNALREAEKAYQALGDAANKSAVETANADYENARRNLDLVSKNARQTEKDILSMTNAIEKNDGVVSKAKNRAGESSGNAGMGGAVAEGLMSKLAGAGLGKMLGDSMSGALEVGISSAFGQSAGSAISTTISGAITGAAMGSIAGPLGTAIGGAVGLVAGGIGAATGNFSEKEDAFKSIVQSQVQEQQGRFAGDIDVGSEIAGNREQKKIMFSTLLGGDAAADDYLSQMTDFAAATPFGYDQLATISKTLLAYDYQQNEILPLLTKVGDGGSSVGMSGEDINVVATSLGRMNSSGKTTMEYLNPLLERGIPAMDYLARAAGKSKAEITEMVSKGLIPGEEAARAIADYMGKESFGSMEKLSQSYSGMLSTVQDAQDNLNAAMGEGYNEERKKGLSEQVAYLSGESGDQAQEANRLIGAWKADLENQREERLRSAESDAYERIQQDNLSGAEAGKVLAQARIQAEADYMNSEGARLEVEMQTALVASTRQIMLDDEVYQKFGYDMGIEFSKGMKSAIQSEQPYLAAAEDYERYKGQIPDSSIGALPYVPGMDTTKPPAHAAGLAYVPRDNYLARLHEGEQVLTAEEARSRQTNKNGVVITGNHFEVREETDVDKIAQALFEKIDKAQRVS